MANAIKRKKACSVLNTKENYSRSNLHNSDNQYSSRSDLNEIKSSSNYLTKLKETKKAVEENNKNLQMLKQMEQKLTQKI